MNLRDRFLAVFHYEKVDRLPDFEFGYWKETLERWAREGHVPKEIVEGGGSLEGEDFHARGENFFGFERRRLVPVETDLYPPLERKLLEETEKYVKVRNERGIVCRELKKHETMPDWIEFPVKDREDFENWKEKFDPSDPGRYPDDWELLARAYRNRDYPLGIKCGSLYGWLRYWMGFERLSRAFVKEPDLVEDMMEFLTGHIVEVVSRTLEKLEQLEVGLDFSTWWEDMCYNKGPLISPDAFERLMVPRYRRIVSVLEDYGIDIHYVDSDGNIEELVPLWLKAGINCMFPLEAAHTDPKDLRERFGKRLLLMGGVDKRALIDGSRRAINRELARLQPLMERGGFIPHLDHRVPPDVEFDSYEYYIRRKREMLGRS